MKYVIATSAPAQGVINVGNVYEVASMYNALMEEVATLDEACLLHVREIGKKMSCVQVSKDYFREAPFTPYVINLIEAKVREYLDNNAIVKYSLFFDHKHDWQIRWGVVMKADKNGTIDFSSACNSILANQIMEETLGLPPNSSSNHINSGNFFINKLIEGLISKWRAEGKEKQEKEAAAKLDDMQNYVNPKRVNKPEPCL